MRIALPLLLCLNLLSSAMPAHAIALVDDAGARLQLHGPVRRVISLSPHLTELMFSIGAGALLVASARGSDFPAEAAALPEIGDVAGLDFERILALRPDLVLAWHSGNRTVDVERLRALGLRVLVLEPKRLEDIGRHLRMLGFVTGLGENAHARALNFEQRIDALRQRYAKRAPVRVLFEIWHSPLFTVNGEHLISDVLGLCAAENIFSSLPRLAGEVSIEQVLLIDPDAIVVGSEAPDAGVVNWMKYPYLQAVRNGNVLSISADLITRQTIRIADAAERVCAGLDKARH